MKLFMPVVSLMVLFIFGNLLSFGQSSSKWSMNNYVSVKGDTLRYRQLWPDADNMRKYPLVIFLHGSGERGNDNEAQLKWGVANFASDENMFHHPAIVIAPQCPEKLQWSNFSRDNNMKLQSAPSRPMELLIELIQQAMKNLPVDSSRIYITGLSMGGYGTYDAIERYPHLFAAAVPVCGAGDASLAPSIAHIPIWIFHGAEDPAVDPKYSLEMFNALSKAGAHVGFTQYPAVGHFSWIGAYSDALMMEWLFKQHK
jgi:predicted peptidase